MADRIFDFLLQEGQIKLLPNHVIPSAEELKKIKYCEWHNATSHGTNECKVLMQQLQSAIESGRIKFDSSKTQKLMKIDQHPFPTNMLDAKGKTKVLTPKNAEENVSVDPQHQVTTDDAKGKGLLKESGSSRRPPRSSVMITHRQHRETWQQREDRYRRQQEKRRRQEWNRHRDHWDCSFFVHCWEQGIKLPTVQDCPKCNGYHRHDRSNRRFQPDDRRFNGPIRGRTSVHDRLGGRLNVHERLGERVGNIPRNQEELEEMANARVPDEEVFYRDPNIRRVESSEVCYQPVWKTKLPRWCLEGLTRTQRRRMQRECQEDLCREESSSKPENRQQPDRKGKGPSVDVNMVFMLPMEFLAPSSDDEANLSDQIAQLALDLMMAVFEKPIDDERQQLKALFVKGKVDGQPVFKVLIDGGAAINIMPYVMYWKLGKGDQDFTKTDMMLKDFEGNVSPVKGVVCVELTIGSKTLPTTFFVINGKGAYNLLLGRDWIHANCCTMHQCLVQWVGDKLKLSLEILLILLHQRSQILMSGLSAYREKPGKRISSRLPIMRFH